MFGSSFYFIKNNIKFHSNIQTLKAQPNISSFRTFTIQQKPCVWFTQKLFYPCFIWINIIKRNIYINIWMELNFCSFITFFSLPHHFPFANINEIFFYHENNKNEWKIHNVRKYSYFIQPKWILLLNLVEWMVVVKII